MSSLVDDFADEHRRDLILAEEAYVDGRYGESSYSEEDVKRITRAAENLISLLDRVVRDVKLG